MQTAHFFNSSRTEIASTHNTINNQMQNENIKITQIIKDWFDSWQLWQQKILITGIVNRFEQKEVKNLLMAMEPVFHKDFMATVRNVYPVSRVRASLSESEKSDSKRIDILTKIKLAAKRRYEEKRKKSLGKDKKKSKTKTIYQSPEMATHVSLTEKDIYIPSDTIEMKQGTPSRPTSIKKDAHMESQMLHTKEKDDQEILKSGHLYSKNREDGCNASPLPIQASYYKDNMGSGTSQASSLASSPLPTEESSNQEPVLEDMENQEKDNIKVHEQRLQATSGKKSPKKKKTKKKVISEEVVKRIASAASSHEQVKPITPVSSYTYSAETVHEFHSDLCFNIETNDFFEDNNYAMLGEPATTQSKMDANFMQKYDSKRNKIPLPTTKQIYKNEKLWKVDTVKPNVTRLKEHFLKQLDQIWNWMNHWAPYHKKRLLLMLFSNCGEKTLQYAAECIKNKFNQMKQDVTTIDDLTDMELKMLFSFLNPHELQQASWVCKRWYYLITSDEGLWKRKCHEIGKVYGISNLDDLLLDEADANQALDWQCASLEVYQYLVDNVQPVEEEVIESSSSEESEYEEEEVNEFPNYIPYWKTVENSQGEKGAVYYEDGESQNDHQSDRKTLTPHSKMTASPNKQKGGFLEMWKNITEDIIDANLEDNTERTDQCIDVDLFVDMQEWSDVELLTNVGQRFAVSFHIEEAIKSCMGTWDVEHHLVGVRKVQIFKAHTGSVNCVKYHENRIFSGSCDRQLRVWTRMGECFAKMTEDIKGGINDISIGPIDQSRLMFTASWDMSIKVWNSVNFQLKRTLTGHKGAVSKVSADNKYIVSASHDGTIKVWNRKSFICERTLYCHTGDVLCMIYHNRQIYSGGIDRKIVVNNPKTGKVILTYEGHQYPVTALKKQHDLLASGDMAGEIYFWSLTSDDCGCVEHIKAHESQINALFMRGPTFLTASNDALVKEWDLVTMTCVRVFQGHTDAVTDVQYTDKFLLTASKDHDVRIWWWKGSEDKEERPKKK